MNKKQPNKKELLDFLYSLPLDEFSKIVKDYDKIHKSKVNKFNMVTQILKLENIDAIIIKLLLKEKKIHIDAEDIDILAYLGISEIDLSMDSPLDIKLSRHLPSVREDSPLYNPNAYPSAEQLEELKNKKNKVEITPVVITKIEGFQNPFEELED